MAQLDSVARSGAAYSREPESRSEESAPIREFPDSHPDCSGADSRWNSLVACFPVLLHKARSPERAPEQALSATYCREFPESVLFEEYWDLFASGASPQFPPPPLWSLWGSVGRSYLSAASCLDLPEPYPASALAQLAR